MAPFYGPNNIKATFNGNIVSYSQATENGTSITEKWYEQTGYPALSPRFTGANRVLDQSLTLERVATATTTGTLMTLTGTSQSSVFNDTGVPDGWLDELLDGTTVVGVVFTTDVGGKRTIYQCHNGTLFANVGDTLTLSCRVKALSTYAAFKTAASTLAGFNKTYVKVSE